MEIISSAHVFTLVSSKKLQHKDKATYCKNINLISTLLSEAGVPYIHSIVLDALEFENLYKKVFRVMCHRGQ